ncbi:MAG: uL30 family ribosomal protein [Candidatus Micrarchaeia archaeon]
MKIAVIRVRGIQGVRNEVSRAMREIKLTRKHACVIVDERSQGVLHKVKDYVTWGEATPETVALVGKKKSLHPPVGGWKGSIKRSYPEGALGKRKDINELIKRMSC